MAEHRVPLLRSSLRRVDPARSRDPRVRSVVSQLAELRLAPAPDPVFRAELRAQLVAVAPRLVAEGAATPAAREQAGAAARTSEKAPAERARRGIPILRPLRVVTAVLAVFGLLLGGAVWMSRKALPGDNLYGLKRAGEQVELSLAGNDRDRAADRLEFAQNRIAEVKELWTRATATAQGAGPHAAGAPSTQTSRLITDTLAAADSDVVAAASLLNADAVRTHSASPLQTMTTWASGAASRLTQISDAMPKGSLRNHAVASSAIVDAASHRASALRGDLGRSCLNSSGTDRYGPQPCRTTATPTRRHPGGSSGGSGPGGGSPRTSTTHAPRRSTPAATRHTTAPAPKKPAASATPTPSTSSTPISTPTVPGLPKISIGKCISVSAGPINIGIGKCGPG